jgi:hypothetical protein
MATATIAYGRRLGLKVPWDSRNRILAKTLTFVADDIYRIKFSDPAIWKSELIQRYLALDALGSALPPRVDFPPSTTSGKPLFTNDDLAQWFTEVLREDHSGKSSEENDRMTTTTATGTQIENHSEESEPPTKVNMSALLLALCGWSGEKIADVPIAICQKCFARLGLWLYQSNPESQAEEETMKLDPVSLHRSYCPWQDPSSQGALSAFEGMAGWQVLSETIGGQIERTKRRQKSTSVPEDDVDLDSIITSRTSKEELDHDDRARESKLARLRRAFAGKKNRKT